jgi:hypothetical protein
MKAVATLLSVFAIAFVSNEAAAQARPDFSGRWTTEPEASADDQGRGQAAQGQRGQRGGRGGRGGRGRGPTGDMGSGWGPTITIAQEANTLAVEYVFFGRGDLQPPLRFTYALDGSETKNRVMMGRGIQEQTSRAAWEGSNLVITTVHDFTNPQNGQPVKAEVKRVLTLASPDQLVVEVTRGGVLGGPATTSRAEYRRLEG